MEHMKFFYAMNLAPECSPVETSPVPVLQVNQNCQDEEYYCAGQNALFIHEGKKLRAAALATRSGKRQFQGK